jgi:hypothetical protein
MIMFDPVDFDLMVHIIGYKFQIFFVDVMQLSRGRD